MALSSLRLVLLGSPDAAVYRAAREFLGDRVMLALDTDERVSVSRLQDARPDVILAAYYHWRIGPKQRASARLGAVGLHPSLLPRYRGSYPLWWAMRNREREVGLSLYHLTDEMDGGNVIAQRSVPTGRSTFAGLYERVAALTPLLLHELLEHIEATGRIPEGTPQDPSQATYFDTPSLLSRAMMKAWWAVSRTR